MIIAATDEHFAALIAGTAPDGFRIPEGGVEAVEVLQMLRSLAQRLRPQFDPASWLIVVDGEIVGLCSITKTVPASAGIEIGYGVAPARRGRGHAAAAVADLLDRARSQPAIAQVTADTSVRNPASQRVLERNNFVRAGERIDPEDRPLICWQIKVS